MEYLIVKSLLLGQPATTSRRLSHFANFCISVKEKVELVVFCLASEEATWRRSTATSIQVNDFGLWAHVGFFP